MAKIEIFLLKIWFQFSKKTNSKFGKVFLLRGKATLPLWNEPKHNYVGLAVKEFYLWARRPTPRMVFDRRPISRPKIENFTRTKCWGISILHMHEQFQASRFNNKKKYPKVVDPLNINSQIRQEIRCILYT